jgi:hypothetical protein
MKAEGLLASGKKYPIYKESERVMKVCKGCSMYLLDFLEYVVKYLGMIYLIYLRICPCFLVFLLSCCGAVEAVSGRLVTPLG